jgi:hypothetical protein
MLMAETNNLLSEWSAQWPAALAMWSRFVQLHEPIWCFTEAEESKAQLSGSFAMIRLVDHSVVISLRQVAELGLQGFAKEILAHEIGHHVYCPADLTDNARMLARMRVGLPTKEHLAPFIANLYSDLLINDRLQRAARLDMSGVYLKLGSECRDQLWTLYMRMYELLWKLERGRLARGDVDTRMNQDAQLGARLIRNYAKDWLDGAGRFAALCLPYLLADEAERMQKLLAVWSDIRCAGKGAFPDGLTEIDDGELTGAIHPADDPELSGVEAPDADGSKGKAQRTGIKTDKTYRQPIDYAEVLKAAGVNADPADVTARYYRERAIPHLIPFPVRKLPQATDPLPEGLDVWDVSTPLEQIDWLGTLLNSPHVIPGVTTRQRQYGTSPGADPETIPVDLYLGVDCSGSMGNPAQRLSYPVLAGAIIALSALRVGSRVKVVLSGEPGRTISTDGFERDAAIILRTLTNYLGTGYSFGIHRLAETFQPDARISSRVKPRPVHILIVSDNDMFSMLDSESKKQLGWDVARQALELAGGGGTFVLELPEQFRNSSWSVNTDRYLGRIADMDWNAAIVSTMEELIAFARQFSRGRFGGR